jgi:putative ABC transport system ATP-binding protein
MFQLENVSKVYSRRGSQVTAIQVESLAIARGDYVAVVGPSGSGKTTLLSLLGGMLSPTTGRVLVDGASVYDQSPQQRAQLRREKIGFVFQSFNLVPYLSALENVQMPLCLNRWPAAQQQARAEELLQRVGLGDRRHHKPSELSVGQQQRVALARTLANSPQIILADEPTGNLDPDSRSIVLDFFDELHRDGCTIVMVTHDQVAAARAKTWLRIEAGVIQSSVRQAA